MRHFFVLFLLSGIIHTVRAQDKIMVHVHDAKTHEPLISASVYWANTTIGTITNTEGVAHIPTAKAYPATLVISYVGYQPDSLLLNSYQPHLHISLTEALQLDVTEVTGKRKEQFIKTLDPLKTEVITQGELRKAACCNLSESFQTNASAQVNYEDAVTGAKQIELLGLKGLYVQNTIENTPALRGLSASFALDNIPAPWIKSIAVAKGTPSVRAGYEGITGSLNIQYKEPADLSPLYLDVFANHTGRIEGNWMSGIQKEKWGTGFFANAAMTRDRKDRNGDSFYDQPEVSQFNLMNRWEYRNEWLESKFMIKGLHEKRVSGQLAYPSENPDGQYGIGITTNRVEGFGKMGILLPGLPEKSIGITASGFWHDQTGFYGLKNYNGRQGSFFGNALYQGYIKNTNHSLLASASIMYDHYDELVNTTRLKRTDIIPGAALEYTYTHLEKITIVSGLRADFPNRFKAQINPRLHLRYAPKEGTQFRIAAGRGFRIPNVYAENIYIFASSREIEVVEEPGFESAWNTGLSVVQDIPLGNKTSRLVLDFFHTRFTNQVVVDIENGHNKVHIYNLDGKSYSNSFLAEWSIEPVKGLDFKVAYRWEDVRQTMHEGLLVKSMVPPHRGLFVVGYRTKDDHWMFNTNVNLRGKHRLPVSFEGDGQRYSPVYAVWGIQATRYQGPFEFFVGGENILNVRQRDPIIGANDPFGSNFDTYQVWGPVVGTVAYGGIRYNMKPRKTNSSPDKH